MASVPFLNEVLIQTRGNFCAITLFPHFSFSYPYSISPLPHTYSLEEADGSQWDKLFVLDNFLVPKQAGTEGDHRSISNQDGSFKTEVPCGEDQPLPQLGRGHLTLRSNTQ